MVMVMSCGLCDVVIGHRAASRRQELQRQTLALSVRPSPRVGRHPGHLRRPPARRRRRQGLGRSADVPGWREPPAVRRLPGQRHHGRSRRVSVADHLEANFFSYADLFYSKFIFYEL